MSIEFFDVSTFSTQKASGILAVGDTFQEVVTLTTPILEAGIYMIAYSFQVDFNGTKDKSMFFQVTGTFGDTTEFAETAGDKDGDHKNRAYSFPKTWAGGAITIGLDMRKEADLGQLDCDFVDVSVFRVG